MAFTPSRAHQRLGAVVTGADAHPGLVEDLGQVVGVDVAVGQRQDAAALGGPGRAEDRQVVAEALLEGLLGRTR